MTEPQAVAAKSIGERIQEAIAITPAVFTIKAFNLSIPVSDTMIMSWIVIAILGIGAWALTRRMREIPGKTQAGVEWFVTFIDDFAEQNMGHHGRPWAPFLGALGLFILTANLLPAFTPVGGFGHEPPFVIKPLTRDINVTAGLAVMIILTVLISGIRYKGPVGWFKKLFKPVPFMVIFNLLEYGIRPLSLSLRLFGNILGAYVLMRLLEMVMPVFLPPIFGLYFDFFDGLIQAVIFVYLSTVYIAEAIE